MHKIEVYNKEKETNECVCFSKLRQILEHVISHENTQTNLFIFLCTHILNRAIYRRS